MVASPPLLARASKGAVEPCHIASQPVCKATPTPALATLNNPVQQTRFLVARQVRSRHPLAAAAGTGHEALGALLPLVHRNFLQRHPSTAALVALSEPHHAAGLVTRHIVRLQRGAAAQRAGTRTGVACHLGVPASVTASVRGATAAASALLGPHLARGFVGGSILLCNNGAAALVPAGHRAAGAPHGPVVREARGRSRATAVGTSHGAEVAMVGCVRPHLASGYAHTAPVRAGHGLRGAVCVCVRLQPCGKDHGAALAAN